MFTVLLSGGSGKRLWPLSNDLRSKQYLKVVKGKFGEKQSMIQRVWSQLETEKLDKLSIVTAGVSQIEIIKSQLGGDIKIAIEPSRRDTFPAIALSCLFLISHMNAKESDCVVVLPVDPYTEQKYFNIIRNMENVLENTSADIVLMGATPKYSSSKYGYILPKNENGNDMISEVKGFKEKPSEDEANDLIKNGALWNCGVFCFKIKYILDILRNLNVPLTYSELYQNYDKLPKISFDYAVVEKCNKLCVVRFDGYWKDIGTWNTLTEEMESKSIGNCIMSNTCENTHVLNELEIPIVVIGTKNLIVAASADGILVSDKFESSNMKEYVKEIGEFPMYEERRWGSLKVIDISSKDNYFTMTRRIIINEGMNSSLHYHTNRDEIWTVLSGDGELILDNQYKRIKTGDSIRIPKMVHHAIRAITKIHLVEIQLGETVGSEDITRLVFDWNDIILNQ